MIRSCLARIGCLTLAVLLAVGAWFLRDDLARWWGGLEIVNSSQPSEPLARRAERKLDRLADGSWKGEMTFSQAELQSLLSYRLAPSLEPGVQDPLIELVDSTLLLGARLDPQALAGGLSPEFLQRFVGDSARVTAELKPDVLTPGVARLRVTGLRAGAVAVPPPMIPWIVGGIDVPGLESEGSVLLLPIPPEVGRLRVRSGELVLSDDAEKRDPE